MSVTAATFSHRSYAGKFRTHVYKSGKSIGKLPRSTKTSFCRSSFKRILFTRCEEQITGRSKNTPQKTDYFQVNDHASQIEKFDIDIGSKLYPISTTLYVYAFILSRFSNRFMQPENKQATKVIVRKISAIKIRRAIFVLKGIFPLHPTNSVFEMHTQTQVDLFRCRRRC